MPTKLILSSSAILLAFAGTILIFAPIEIASWMGWPNETASLIQIVGSLYFGFAMINWMSKANLIGGIYNRPIAVGNLTHFFIAALSLIKIPDKTLVIYCITAVYSIYAFSFGLILFTHPIKESKTE